VSARDSDDYELTRRQFGKIGAQAAAALATGAWLAGCGGSTGGATNGGASTGKSAGTAPLSKGPGSIGTPVRGGTLTVAMISGGAQETVDPRKVVSTTDLIRGLQLYDPLFLIAPGPDGVIPGLAVSAEPNKSATVWTIKLRDGVTFHNGKTLTADDVVYTIKSSWASPSSAYQAATSNLIDVANVRKLDATTVEIPLHYPMAYLPSFASYVNTGIVPDGFTDWNRPIGAGPFKFVSLNPGSSSTFVRNPDYWRGAPHIDQLVINSTFTDDAARLNALLSNQVDIAPNIPPALAKANAGSIILGNQPSPFFLNIAMRVNVRPFNDPRIAKALKLATDREAILRDVYAGYGTIGNDCGGAGLRYWASDIKSEYDPEKAKALLKAAGAEGLTVPMITSNYEPGMVEQATTWSAQAAGVGFKAPVRELPASTYFTTAAPAYGTNARKLSVEPWNIYILSLAGLYLETLASHAIYDETGWDLGPGHEKLIAAALGETNPRKAESLWHAVQEQQVQSGGYIIPVNYNLLDGYGKRVRGVETNSAGNCGNFDFHKAWLTAA